jgi:hypothetical protein
LCRNGTVAEIEVMGRSKHKHPLDMVGNHLHQRHMGLYCPESTTRTQHTSLYAYAAVGPE